MQMLSIGEAAELLGVAVSTLRRWEKIGKRYAQHAPLNYVIKALEEQGFSISNG